jgi:glyoxylase-like metal-dependent hydrolase (beta-lactamase superfamily II)
MPGNGLRLHVLNQGLIEARDAVFLNEQGERELVNANWPVRCYLVEHPRGWLLWDAGLPEEPLAVDPTALGGMPKHIVAPLLPWLGEFGLTPADITYAGFSHLHVDHAGNANEFAASTIVLAAREHVYAFSSGVKGPYRPADYAALRDSRTILVDDTYDVFGDGTVTIVAAPGHSPGHQALAVALPGQPPQILVGDAIYSPADLDHPRAPEWNSDQTESFRSIERLKRIAAESDARLVIHHDPLA